MILLSNLMNETPSFSRISDPASWLEGHYKQLDTVLRAFSRRKGLKEEEMEELRSEIHLHLVERDYAVLRSWSAPRHPLSGRHDGWEPGHLVACHRHTGQQGNLIDHKVQ